MYPPAKFYQNPDGSFRRYHDLIWSDYAVNVSAPYCSASGTWQVPSVSYDGAPNPPYKEEAADSLDGIGGDGDATLIQLGTNRTVFTNGTTSYGAWYELDPAGAVGIPNPVKPGRYHHRLP